MTDTNKLKGLIAMHGYSQTDVAKMIGLSATSFNYKINGIRPFTQKEIGKLISIFRIKNNEIVSIFFGQNVEKIGT